MEKNVDEFLFLRVLALLVRKITSWMYYLHLHFGIPNDGNPAPIC